jgi:hypothetical protein
MEIDLFSSTGVLEAERVVPDVQPRVVPVAIERAVGSVVAEAFNHLRGDTSDPNAKVARFGSN